LLALVCVLSAAVDAYDKEYDALRRLVIDENRSMRLGANLALTEEEKKADTILAAMREAEIKRTEGDFPPQFNFYKMKDTIALSPVLALMHRLPKGGILHGHMEAMSDMHFYTEQLMRPDLYINMNDRSYEMRISKEHPGGDFVLGSEAANTFPGGESALKNFLFTQMIMTDGPEMSGDGVRAWKKFGNVFRIIGGVVNYLPLRLQYMRQTFDGLVADKVFYWEVRLITGGVFNDTHTLSVEEELAAYRSLLADYRVDVPQFTFKIIITTSRSLPHDAVFETMKMTLELHNKYPDFVIGFDLVGEEDTGHTTYYYVEDVAKIIRLSDKYERPLPLFFHDGETARTGNLNVFDAILLGARRIAHGFNIFHYPALMETMKELNVTLEVCPISNQVLRLVDDMRNHPASSYVARGMSVTINSDDAGLLNYDGVYWDYYMAFMSWDVDIRTLKALARNSLEASSLAGSERAVHLKLWESQWAAFVADLVAGH